LLAIAKIEAEPAEAAAARHHALCSRVGTPIAMIKIAPAIVGRSTRQRAGVWSSDSRGAGPRMDDVHLNTAHV